MVAILALYRAGSFIHEITHIKPNAVPGFYWAWNALVGVPLLVPSFMYEGVHNQHHAKTYYGTAEDPEYLPLALMQPWTLPVFLIAAALAPIGMLIRFGLLAPLSLLSPKLREAVVAKYSGLQINPRFRRPRPTGEFKRRWTIQEAGGQPVGDRAYCHGRSGVIPLRAFLIFLAVSSGVMFLNQVRTLVAHLWENDGEPMSVTEQYLDSVNVPPPATLPALWAPVGLRYHALHHLLPGVPYHNLGEAHRRLARRSRRIRPISRRTIGACRRWSRGLPSSQLEGLRASTLPAGSGRTRRSAGTAGTAPRRRGTAGMRRNCPVPG